LGQHTDIAVIGSYLVGKSNAFEALNDEQGDGK